MLEQWNDTGVDVPRASMHELIEAAADRHPDAIAAVYGVRQLSYGELDSRATRLAHYLRSLGAGPEAVVGICMERSLSMLVAVLGIMKSGAAYLPLDPEFPTQRVKDMLAQVRAPIVLIDSSLRDRFPIDGCLLVEVDSGGWDQIARQPDRRFASAARPENLAYCMFTSGSTGEPKAVAITHASLVNFCLHTLKAWKLGPGDRMLQFSRICVDPSVAEIYPTWLAGGTLVLHPEQVQSSREFLRYLRDHDVSVLSLPVAYWHRWVEDCGDLAADWPDKLRLVAVGGDKVLAERIRTWKAFPFTRDVVWMVDYGPTETTMICAAFTPERACDIDEIPIGPAISNAQLYLLDASGNPVPDGVEGEICIGGAGLARCYVGRAALTAASFVPNPFGAAGSRIYRTGDLGCRRSDGHIIFRGRRDGQIKVRGHRVEPGEVEAGLMRCRGVRQAVVVGREDRPGEMCLVAYVVADGFDARSLRAQLHDLLPAAMVPADFVRLDTLPVSTITGKIERSRLPAVSAPQSGLHAASKLENAIARLWTDVMGRPPVSVHEDFFMSGGDSLRGLSLVGRISELTGLDIVLADLFKTRTVEALVMTLLQKSSQREWS